MAHRGPWLAGQGRLFALGRRCWAALLVLLPGCQLPAARYAPPNARGCVEARPLALANQVVVDSSLEMTHHPVRCSWALLHETGNQLQSVTRGELGKRVLLPLRGCPEPLARCPDYPDHGV